MKGLFLKVWQLIKKFFWEKPTAEVKIKATQVAHNYVVITYHGQRINLHKSELSLWNGLSRKDRRAMANKFQKLEKSGKIKFVKIDDREVCVYNRDYEKRIGK